MSRPGGLGWTLEVDTRRPPLRPDTYGPFRDRSGLPSWDERIRALVPPSVDETLIRESLKLTPTERIECLQALYDAWKALQATR